MSTAQLYVCEPNPSGRGSFSVRLPVCPNAGHHIFVDGARYEVLQVQHIYHGPLEHPTVMMKLVVVKR